MKAFRFLDNPSDTDALHRALEQVGLRFVNTTGEKLVFRCEWLAKPVELTWTVSWWPDGVSREDASVTVAHNEIIVARFDIAPLLRQKHSKRLPEIIIDDLATACGTLTGKSYRSARRTGA